MTDSPDQTPTTGRPRWRIVRFWREYRWWRALGQTRRAAWRTAGGMSREW